MPLYEYVCRSCSADFEILLPAGRRDSGDTTCPLCGETKTARKVSLIGRPVMSDAGRSGGSAQPFDCGSPGGCCGGGGACQ